MPAEVSVLEVSGSVVPAKSVNPELSKNGIFGELGQEHRPLAQWTTLSCSTVLRIAAQKSRA